MERTMERTGNFLPRTEDGSAGQVANQIVTLTAPASAAAEQYRTLYYRLERLRASRPMKLVALTSALPGEGKTLTAVNLALTAARATPDRRILLIDGDLRRSQVAKLLGIRNTPGLSELLAGECEVQQVVRHFQSTRLALLPAGAMVEEPTRILSSPAMRELLRAVRENFDEVYLDLPPTLPFADATILGPQVDGLLMVVRAHATPGRLIEQAVEMLMGAPLVGCVLNGAHEAAIAYPRVEGKRR